MKVYTYDELSAAAQLEALANELQIWEADYEMGDSEVDPAETTVGDLEEYIRCSGIRYDEAGHEIDDIDIERAYSQYNITLRIGDTILMVSRDLWQLDCETEHALTLMREDKSSKILTVSIDCDDAEDLYLWYDTDLDCFRARCVWDYEELNSIDGLVSLHYDYILDCIEYAE